MTMCCSGETLWMQYVQFCQRKEKELNNNLCNNETEEMKLNSTILDFMIK